MRVRYSSRVLIVVVVVAVAVEQRAAAVLLGKVRSLGCEELGRQVALWPLVGVASLARLAVLELRVRGEKALVVGRAAEGLFASGLRIRSVSQAAARSAKSAYGIKRRSVGGRHIGAIVRGVRTDNGLVF